MAPSAGAASRVVTVGAAVEVAVVALICVHPDGPIVKSAECVLHWQAVQAHGPARGKPGVEQRDALAPTALQPRRSDQEGQLHSRLLLDERGKPDADAGRDGAL